MVTAGTEIIPDRLTDPRERHDRTWLLPRVLASKRWMGWGWRTLIGGKKRSTSLARFSQLMHAF
jgi:hypothetical protein